MWWRPCFARDTRWNTEVKPDSGVSCSAPSFVLQLLFDVRRPDAPFDAPVPPALSPPLASLHASTLPLKSALLGRLCRYRGPDCRLVYARSRAAEMRDTCNQNVAVAFLGIIFFLYLGFFRREIHPSLDVTVLFWTGDGHAIRVRHRLVRGHACSTFLLLSFVWPSPPMSFINLWRILRKYLATPFAKTLAKAFANPLAKPFVNHFA